VGTEREVVINDPRLLEEVSEEAARGSVADTYADIRRVLGVPMVVFVYRALAASPGRLERVWSVLRPSLVSVATQRNAESLDASTPGAVIPVDTEVLERARVSPRGLAVTLDAFDRANRLNLIGLEALLAGTRGDQAADRTEAQLSPTPAEMLPMANLNSLEPHTHALLQMMSARIAGPERPILIPSLFRYFAHDEGLLRAIWRSIGPVVEHGRFPESVASVRTRACELSSRLPYPVPSVDDGGTREITSRVAAMIPGMIVTTKLLRLAFAGHLSGPTERLQP